uniref:ABC transmembrane type-1 domain-containing protein n=1 Tax=Arcella intermedia TaxID=1963864 RepID=A0A6B2L5Y6_9EUKA
MVLLLLKHLKSFDFYRPVGLGFASSFVVTFSTLSENYLAGCIIDVFSQSEGYKDFDKEDLMTKVNYYCYVLCLVYFVQFLSMTLESFMFQDLGSKIGIQFKNTLFGHLMYQTQQFYDLQKSGHLLEVFSTSIKSLQDGLSSHFPDLLNCSIRVLFAICYLFYLSWKLTLAIFIATPIVGLALYFQGNVVGNLTTTLLEAQAKLTGKANESISHIKAIKLFNQEETQKAIYSEYNEEYYKTQRKLTFIDSITDGGVTLSVNVCITIGMWYGGILVISGELSPGDLISYTLSALLVHSDLTSIPTATTKLNKMLLNIHKLFVILESPVEKDTGNIELNYVRGDISFEKVTFHYPARAEVGVLQDFDLTFESGKSTALVGKSGQGKSTIISLLMSNSY